MSERRCALAVPVCVVLVFCLAAATAAPVGDPARHQGPMGGDTTVADTSRNAFSNPAATLQGDRLRPFFVGNSFFRRNWVEAPASTGARDGLGPFFHARSCTGCHVLDGRALPPTGGKGTADDTPGLLVRLSVPGTDEFGAPRPEPRYGSQFAPQAIQGVAAEGRLRVDYRARPGRYPDGTAYTLREPVLRFEQLGYGPFAPEVQVSARLAPQIIGMGLLEAIPEADLLAAAERQAATGGPVRGRVNRVWDAIAQATVVGRFGWKANAGSVAHQVGAAFVGDIGISSVHFPAEECMPAQTACAQAPRGGATGRPGEAAAGQPEIDAHTFEQVVFYTRMLAVPAQRDAEHPQVRRGAALFDRVGCDACHQPVQHTAPVDSLPEGQRDGLRELAGQRLRPYTDLLLHDMGPALADGRPDHLAGARDWRTPPLWGLGLVDTVNGGAAFLHDGRARTLEEAVLWHGGEAQASRDAFTRLARDERAALLRFLASL